MRGQEYTVLLEITDDSDDTTEFPEAISIEEHLGSLIDRIDTEIVITVETA